jgi:hypothetical protein
MFRVGPVPLPLKILGQFQEVPSSHHEERFGLCVCRPKAAVRGFSVLDLSRPAPSDQVFFKISGVKVVLRILRLLWLVSLAGGPSVTAGFDLGWLGGLRRSSEPRNEAVGQLAR